MQLLTKKWRAPTHKISEPGNKISETSISERHGSWVCAPIACAVDLGFTLSRFSVRVVGAWSDPCHCRDQNSISWFRHVFVNKFCIIAGHCKAPFYLEIVTLYSNSLVRFWSQFKHQLKYRWGILPIQHFIGDINLKHQLKYREVFCQFNISLEISI